MALLRSLKSAAAGGLLSSCSWSDVVQTLNANRLSNLGADQVTLGVEVTEETVSGYYDVYATDRPTTRYYHDGQSGYEEDYTRKVSGTDTVDVVRYGLGPRGIESQRVWSGSVGSALPQTALGFPVYDTHGNNVGMVSLSGSVAHERTYSPWGEVLASNGSPPQQGYCANLGHRSDAESALIYMRARYYEPTTGRFISEDPAMDGLNWCSYCDGDPINKVDSSGKSASYVDIQKWLGPVSAIAMILLGAHLDPVVRGKALADVGFLLAWFSLDVRDRAGTGDMRVLGGLLINAMVDLIAVCATWDRVVTQVAGSSSPALKAVALGIEHVGFLMLFMSLEAIAEGY